MLSMPIVLDVLNRKAEANVARPLPYQQRVAMPVHLRSDPMLKNLKGDPRYGDF